MSAGSKGTHFGSCSRACRSAPGRSVVVQASVNPRFWVPVGVSVAFVVACSGAAKPSGLALGDDEPGRLQRLRSEREPRRGRRAPADRRWPAGLGGRGLQRGARRQREAVRSGPGPRRRRRGRRGQGDRAVRDGVDVRPQVRRPVGGLRSRGRNPVPHRLPPGRNGSPPVGPSPSGRPRRSERGAQRDARTLRRRHVLTSRPMGNPTSSPTGSSTPTRRMAPLTIAMATTTAS